MEFWSENVVLMRNPLRLLLPTNAHTFLRSFHFRLHRIYLRCSGLQDPDFRAVSPPDQAGGLCQMTSGGGAKTDRKS